jgi:hypothetical protein
VPAKKTNWSLKSHFKKKSMSSVKCVQTSGGGERKESSMFYLTLTIKSDEQPDSVLRRLESSDFAIGPHEVRVHGGPALPSLPEPERPRRR